MKNYLPTESCYYFSRFILYIMYSWYFLNLHVSLISKKQLNIRFNRMTLPFSKSKLVEPWLGGLCTYPDNLDSKPISATGKVSSHAWLYRFSKPQFPLLQNGCNNSTDVSCENRDNSKNCLASCLALSNCLVHAEFMT